MCTVFITAREMRFINVHSLYCCRQEEIYQCVQYILLQRRWDFSVCTATICTTAGETCAQYILMHGEIHDLSMYTVYTAARGDT